MSSNLNQRLAGLKQQLLAEKKKIGILGGLFVVLVVVCLKQFTGSATPVEAIASTQAPPPPPSMAPIAVESKTASPMIETVKAPASLSPSKKVEIAGMPRDLGRDLFDTKAWNSFRPAITLSQRAPRPTSGPSDTSLWKEALSAIAASQREQRKESEEIDKQLTALSLQSTMTGDLPMAYISGRLLREGQAIDGFAIVSISDRRVLVRKGPFTRQLVMP
jgi:hypothetical protein